MKLSLVSAAAVAAVLIAAAPASAVVYTVVVDPVTSVPAFPNTTPQRTAVAAGTDQIYYQFSTTLPTMLSATFQSPMPTFQFAAPFTLYVGQTCTDGGCVGAGVTIPFNGASSPNDPGTSQAGFSNYTLAANNYTLLVQGTAPSATSVSNSFSFGSPAPEPATWGLMVLGFGAVGAALRTSRRKVVFA